MFVLSFLSIISPVPKFAVRMVKSNPASKTLHDYSEAATVHGVSYVFSRSLPTADRILWALITIACLSLAIYWSVAAFGNWQDNLVETSLKDPAMPVGKLPFPAVTICSSGLDMEAVNDKLMKDFNSWKEKTGKTSLDSIEKDKAHLKEYMRVKFEIDDISTKNIFDIIRALSSPDPKNTMKSLSLLGRVIACAEESKSGSENRKKRSPTTQIFPFQHEGSVYTRAAVENGKRMDRVAVTETCNILGMKPLCRKAYLNNEKECSRGNLADNGENNDILKQMKCSSETQSCPELYNNFFYLRGNGAKQTVPPIAGQQDGQMLTEWGTSGVIEGKDGYKEGVQYTSTDAEPLYTICVLDAGETL